ncbi:hypothetical protein [Streptomyces misionensis]|uniref:hypothetical protein n=1 Tax=Streptomyces misionensis TaxID=67331 RepID=UPI00367F931A
MPRARVSSQAWKRAIRTTPRTSTYWMDEHLLDLRASSGSRTKERRSPPGSSPSPVRTSCGGVKVAGPRFPQGERRSVMAVATSPGDVGSSPPASDWRAEVRVPFPPGR